MIVAGTQRRACTTANCSGGIGEHIDWVLQPNRRYAQIDGITLVTTTDGNGLFQFDLLARTSMVNGFAWTGMNGNWTEASGGTCTNWTVSTGNPDDGFLGNFSALNSGAIGSAQAYCNGLRRLLCVEQP